MLFFKVWWMKIHPHKTKILTYLYFACIDQGVIFEKLELRLFFRGRFCISLQKSFNNPAMFPDKRKSVSTCPGWVRRCAGRSGRKSTGTGVTSAVAPGWASPESVGTSGTASPAPAPTTSTWSTALAGQRTDATQPPGT